MIMQQGGQKPPVRVKISTGAAHVGVAIEGEDYFDGDVVDVDATLAPQLVNEGRAVLAPRGAQVGRAKRDDKGEGNPPPAK
jgi:hypothetical protein